MPRFLCGLTVAVFVLFGSATQARTPPDYVAPSNFELVQIVEAIVVGTPVDMIIEGDGPARMWRSRWTMSSRGRSCAATRWSCRASASTSRQPLSDPSNLLHAHPEAQSDSCQRLSFRAGQPAVLFLERDGSGWELLPYPLARVSEDYFGTDALWPQTVRLYLDIQARNTPMRQLAALEHMLANELANPDADNERMLARDIARHLATPSQWKPTRYLVDAYEAVERGQTPRVVGRPLL
jgi:hypothetical protein